MLLKMHRADLSSHSSGSPELNSDPDQERMIHEIDAMSHEIDSRSINRSINIGVRPDEPSEPLSLAAYQDYYSRRVKHLETFKRTVTANPCGSSEDPLLQKTMLTLRNDMATLIEQDVTLMRQLLGIKDAIEDLKISIGADSPSSSSGESGEEPKFFPSKFYPREHDEETPSPSPSQPSVLRIPIGKKHHQKRRNLTHDSNDSQSSGNSSGFCSQTSSPTALEQPPVRPPRSKHCHRSHRDARRINCGIEETVELVLTDPQEVSI